jgi:hypothetical protein
MAQDNKMTNEQVIEFLYNQFNSGLGKGNLIDKLRIIHKTGTDD